MKFLSLIPILGIALSSVCCRTVPPIDPMTLKPTTRCLPENLNSAAYVNGTK